MSEKAIKATGTMKSMPLLYRPTQYEDGESWPVLRALEMQAMEMRPNFIMSAKVGTIRIKECTGLVVNSQLFC